MTTRIIYPRLPRVGLDLFGRNRSWERAGTGARWSIPRNGVKTLEEDSKVRRTNAGGMKDRELGAPGYVPQFATGGETRDNR